MNGAKFPTEFESITKDGSVQRLRIPGGWLVRSTTHYVVGVVGVACSESMVEIKDDDGFPIWQL